MAPLNYKTICISLYNEDLKGLDAKVKVLKTRGHTGANRSWLIRQALHRLDLDSIELPADRRAQYCSCKRPIVGAVDTGECYGCNKEREYKNLSMEEWEALTELTENRPKKATS